MNTFKQYIKLGIAFALGAMITYLAMSLHFAKQELKPKTSQADRVAKTETSNQQAKEEKHWLEERIEKNNTKIQEHIKQQQSKGDKLKSQFDQFKE